MQMHMRSNMVINMYNVNVQDKKGIVLRKQRYFYQGGQKHEYSTKAICFVAKHDYILPPRYSVEENVRRKKEKSFLWTFFENYSLIGFSHLQTTMRQILFDDITIQDNSIGSPESSSHEELSVEFEAFV